jgi:hypothetical protein
MLDVSAKLELFSRKRRVILFGILQAPYGDVDDYIPTGFKPNGNAPYPVKGHRFGLTLSEEDRKALIAFLKTL